MTLPTTTDPFRPDDPRAHGDHSPLYSALAHAAAGYAVVPVVYRSGSKGKKTKQPVRAGAMARGTTDPSLIRHWWSKYPTAQVGINLTDLSIVVLDEDGPASVESVAKMLRGARLTRLPDTYSVTTGRHGGGHRLYRIPAGKRLDLATQYSSQHDRPALDIKMTGLLVVPGSLHHTGSTYIGNWDHVPQPGDLPYLPERVWSQIEKRGRRRADLEPEAGRSRPRQTASGSMPVAPVVTSPYSVTDRSLARWEGLLNDLTHGKDSRVYDLVLGLLGAGISEEEIREILLASPLGARVRRERDSEAYLDHKFASAYRYFHHHERSWDRTEWRTRVFASGLTDSKVRVLDHLGTVATTTGIVVKSVARIGLDTALSDPTDLVHDLVATGWLEVLRPGDPKTRRPAMYALTVPPSAQIPRGESSGSPHRPRPPEWSPPGDLSAFTDHDAFRSQGNGKFDTLAGTYRLLCLLHRGGGLSTTECAQLLNCSLPTARRLLGRLRAAGLLVTAGRMHTLNDHQPVRVLLDQAARRCGTAGTRDRLWAQYVEEAQRAAEFREAMATVGTPEWWQVNVKDTRRRLESSPVMKPVRDLWGTSITLDDLAERLTAAYHDVLTRDVAWDDD